MMNVSMILNQLETTIVLHEVNLYCAAILRHVTDARIHDQLQFDLAEHHWNFVDDYDDDGNVDED